MMNKQQIQLRITSLDEEILILRQNLDHKKAQKEILLTVISTPKKDIRKLPKILCN